MEQGHVPRQESDEVHIDATAPPGPEPSIDGEREGDPKPQAENEDE